MHEKNPYIRHVINVTKGIFVKNGCVLAAQRPATMSLAFKWELPGGKVEEGEDPHTCLQRETMEELGLEVIVDEQLDPVDRFFNDKHYRMLPFSGEICEGAVMTVYEHEQALWIPIDELNTYDWAPAEQLILNNWIEVRNRFKPSEDQQASSRIAV